MIELVAPCVGVCRSEFTVKGEFSPDSTCWCEFFEIIFWKGR